MNKICIKKSYLFLVGIILLIAFSFYIFNSLNSKNIAYKSEAATLKIPKLIISGTPTNNEWPFVVSITYTANSIEEMRKKIFCTGSLIAPQWILTSAHCLIDEDDLSKIIIIMGIEDYSNGNYGTVQLYGIDSFISYPKYWDDVVKYDIGLIKINRISDKQYISVNTNDSINLSQGGLVVGWGIIDRNTLDIPMQLQEAKVNIIKNNSILSRNRYNYQITPKYSSKAICGGDSGGPLLYWNTNKWILIGISKSSYFNCHGGDFVNISKYNNEFTDWIKSNIPNYDPSLGNFVGNPH